MCSAVQGVQNPQSRVPLNGHVSIHCRHTQVKNPEAIAAAAAAASAAGGVANGGAAAAAAPTMRMTLTKVVYRLKKWKHLLECRVFHAPSEVPLQRCSPYLAQVKKRVVLPRSTWFMWAVVQALGCLPHFASSGGPSVRPSIPS